MNPATPSRLPPGLIRLDLWASENKKLVVAVLAALAVIAVGAGIYVYATPGTETVTTTTDVREISTEVTHGTVVATNSSPWRHGQRLRDQPVYLTNASPVLQLNTTTAVKGGAFSSLTQDLYLVTEARFQGETFWRSERVVDFSVLSGESSEDRLGAAVNTTRFRQRVGRQNALLNGVGSLRTRLRLNVSYETGEYEGEYTMSAPLTVTGDYYRVEGEMANEVRRGSTERRERQRPRNVPLTMTLFVAGLVAGGGAFLLHRRERSVFELERRRRELHRQRHAEWISRGSVPEDAGETRIAVETIEDLVDTAIDSDLRVIYDADRRVYAVFDGDTVYRYEED